MRDCLTILFYFSVINHLDNFHVDWLRQVELLFGQLLFKTQFLRLRFIENSGYLC